MTLEEEIKTLARETGFDQVGITAPLQLQTGERAVEKWVSEGRHAEMRYLEDFSTRRQRFYSDFTEARSVIVLGVNYYSLPEKASADFSSGRVARYAWGKNYHRVIAEKHKIFIERLKEIAPELQAKSCVDTQPLPERFAAVRAGVGFIGKNTMVLSRKFGPWLFLSEIVTNLELAEDSEDSGNCGTCVRCQKNCPTGALDEDYRLDARRCIAYWTIEHKGVIPTEMRPAIGNWVFGCDACLDVCPFTSKSQEAKTVELRAESGVGSQLDLKQLFEIRSNSEYEKRFEGTALLRATRKQLLRNACVVLGNSKSPEALPFLKLALKDAAALVRLHAAWALGQLEISEATEVLAQAEPQEEDASVLAEMRNVLYSSAPPEAKITQENL